MHGIYAFTFLGTELGSLSLSVHKVHTEGGNWIMKEVSEQRWSCWICLNCLSLEVREAAQSIKPDLVCVACGSFRRGKSTCGDVDVLVTHPDGFSHQGIFSKLLDNLRRTGMGSFARLQNGDGRWAHFCNWALIRSREGFYCFSSLGSMRYSTSCPERC